MLTRFLAAAIAFALLTGASLRAWSAPWAGRIQSGGVVADVSTTALDITFGVADGATDEFDRGIDLLAPPPSPVPYPSAPPDPHLLNLLDPSVWLQKLTADMRGEPAEASDEIAWSLVIAAADGIPPDVTDWSMTWDVSEAGAEWAELRMTNDADGVDIDMRATTTLPIALGTTTTYTIRALPSAPPIIVPTAAAVGVGITVEALVYGAQDRIVRARLDYASADGAEYRSATFTPDAGNVWSARIPAWQVTSAGILWRAVIEDADTGVHRTHSIADPGYIPAQGSATLTLRATPGAQPIWNVVAPTVWPEFADIAATLDGSSGGFLAGWFAWRWNAAEQRWEVPADLGDGTPVATDGFSPGLPWFVAVVGASDQVRDSNGGTVDATRAFGLPLSAGWNLLANPVPFSVVWADEGVSVEVNGDVVPLSEAVAAGVTDGRLIYLGINAQAYVARRANAATPYIMRPGRGWWLYVDEPGATLLIAPTPASE